MYFVVKVGSVTNAQRAIKILRKNGYRPLLSRLDNPQPSDGCGYVVKVTASSEKEIVTLLEKAGITVLGVEVK